MIAENATMEDLFYVNMSYSLLCVKFIAEFVTLS